MASEVACIPILDCSAVGLNVIDSNLADANIEQFGKEITIAFKSSGFCYLTNHGVDKKLIDGYMRVSRSFFAQPDEVKCKHLHTKERNFGWVAVEREAINPERPGDLKEAFNYFPADDDGRWPDIEDFQKYSKLMFDKCAMLAKRLCDCLSVGLGLDKEFMSTAHKSIGTKNNSTTLRTLYYPAITDDSVLKPGQIRLGEHSDYGSITLLFQDDIGGLEADIPGNGFVPVTPIPGTVVVNIGDLMQRWTSDALIATKHRVLIPEVEFRKRKSRQSVVCFIHPDDDYLIKPLDGSGKYQPITNGEYLHQRLNATY